MTSIITDVKWFVDFIMSTTRSVNKGYYQKGLYSLISISNIELSGIGLCVIK